MSFGSTPISTTQLSNNQFPVSAVAVPGTTNGDLTALEGGPISTDSNQNKTAPASMYIKDGYDVTQGTSTDANTVASVMGRLTKIRDLLATTLTVGGTITEANSAAILAGLAIIAGAVSAGKMLTTETNSGAILADLSTINTTLETLATQASLAAAKADLDTLVLNTADLLADGDNLATIATNTSNVPTSGTGTPTSVGGSASAAALLASNASRKGASIYNDSTATLYIGLFAHASLTTSLYTTQVPPNNLYELPIPPIYTGEISGIWSSAAGNARITEMS